MPNIAVATQSIIRYAPERLRLASKRSGSSACRLRDSMTTKPTSSTTAATSDATTLGSVQCEMPDSLAVALDSP